MRKLATAAILVAAGCAGEADMSGTWQVDRTVEGGALVSVWGTGPEDVWAAGGNLDGGIVMHSDGQSWSAVDTGAPAMLWWIYGFSADDVYAVGEHGVILHYDGSSWQRAESGTDVTLYGVWGASADDVWIVGGDPAADRGAVILRGRGTSFRAMTDLPAELAPSVLFKAYGYAADDVIIVGSGGTVLRWDGTLWRRDPAVTSQPLFSLWGRAEDDIFAVGGWDAGTVLHLGRDGWSELDDSAGSGLGGVFTAPDSPTIAVGRDAYILEILPDGTEVEPALPAVEAGTVFHGVWGDSAGTTYAVGGDVLSVDGPSRGVILSRR